MIPGPKPKPAAIKKLHGRSHHKQNTAEPQPEGLSRVPSAPNWLGAVARARWKEIARELFDLNVLTKVDLDALGRYCVVFERWRMAESMLKKQGEIIKTPNGYPMPSPYLAIANTALKQLQSLGSEFGLSPATRTRITTVQPLEEDRLEQELFGKPVKVTRAKRKE